MRKCQCRTHAARACGGRQADSESQTFESSSGQGDSVTVKRIWPPLTAKKAETAPPAFELRREDDRDDARSQMTMCFRSLSRRSQGFCRCRSDPRRSRGVAGVRLHWRLRCDQAKAGRLASDVNIHRSSAGRPRLALLAFEQVTQHRCPAVLSDNPWPLDPRRIVSNMLNVTTCQLGDPITLVAQVKPCDRLLHRTLFFVTPMYTGDRFARLQDCT